MFDSLGRGQVSSMKILWVGLVVAVFIPPVLGFLYALFYGFNRETRKEAIIIAIWAVVWSVLSLLLAKMLIVSGIISPVAPIQFVPGI
jgi:hypothetical protein